MSSHSAFLYHMFNHAQDGYAEEKGFQHLMDSMSPIVNYCSDKKFEECMRAVWQNCELRSIIICLDH